MNELNAHINNVRISLEPTKNQRENIIERTNQVRATLENDSYFRGSDYFSRKTYLQGSWLRNTMIRKPLNNKWDVDIIAIIKYRGFKKFNNS